MIGSVLRCKQYLEVQIESEIAKISLSIFITMLRYEILYKNKTTEVEVIKTAEHIKIISPLL